MEYVNPTSIAQMAQVPKDTSLPGTGYGLMQGWREGEAMAKAKDFLSLSQAAQAQDYAKQQFDMQSKWQDRPFELQKRQTELEGTQLSNQKTKWELGQAHEAAKKAKVMDQLHLVAAFNPLLENAKTEIEKQAVFTQLVNQAQRLGVTVDPDLVYDPNVPNSWDNVLRNSRGAAEISAYDRKYAQEMRQQEHRQKWASGENTADRDLKRTLNREDNDTQLRIAAMRESGQNARESGAKQYQQWRAEIGAAWQRAQRKMQAGEPLTADDKAALVIGPQALAGGAYGAELRTDPNRIGAGAQAKKEGEWQALQGILNPPAPPGNPLPNQAPIQGTPLPPTNSGPSLEERLKRY